MTCVGLSWSNSSSSIFAFPTRAILSWLLHFSMVWLAYCWVCPRIVQGPMLFALLNLTAPCRTVFECFRYKAIILVLKE